MKRPLPELRNEAKRLNTVLANVNQTAEEYKALWIAAEKCADTLRRNLAAIERQIQKASKEGK
jgi:hypothetical protein